MHELERWGLNIPQPSTLSEEQVRAIEEDRQIEQMMNDQNHIEWKLGCCITEMREIVGPAKLTKIIDGLLV